MEARRESSYSVAKAVAGAMQEVALMRAGKMKKPTLEELFENIKIWSEEDEEECTK